MKTAQSGAGSACPGRSVLCVAGDGNIPLLASGPVGMTKVGNGQCGCQFPTGSTTYEIYNRDAKTGGYLIEMAAECVASDNCAGFTHRASDNYYDWIPMGWYY